MDPSDPFDSREYENIDGVEGRPKPKQTIQFMGYQLDRDLLVAKLFYFCFFSAFGSLFPLIAVYFKQLGLSAAQAGWLIGVRPFVEFASMPFWGSFASKFRKGKILMLFSLGCWIVFTLALGVVEPGTPYCLTMETNKTTGQSYKVLSLAKGEIRGGVIGQIKAGTGLKRKKRQTEDDKYIELENSVELVPENSHTDVHHIIGISPEYITSENVPNFDPDIYGTLVSPPFNTRVYRKPAVDQVFLLLFLLIILGEFFSAPAVTLADSCTLAYLKDNPKLYGKQRIFGSLGWGLTMFIVGIGLDYSNAFPNHPCPTKNTTEKNYTLNFAVFSVLMGAAMLVASQFTFPVNEENRADEVQGIIMDTRIDEVSPAVAENARARAPEQKEMSIGPLWLSTLKTFSSPHYAAFLFTIWWLGFGAGLIFGFLFWHLQDIGGSPVLFGMASIINHGTEIIAYFFAFRCINLLGHLKVLYIGLAANCLRFLAYSFLSNPWFVLPFQCLQGATHAITWATATSYISLAAPPMQKSSAQALIQVLYHGIGRGCGALIGGLIIASTGTKWVFRIYAAVCLLVLAAFIGLSKFFKAEGIKYRAGAFEQFEDEGIGALAPQGIPMQLPDDNLTEKFSQPAGNYGAVEEQRDPTQDAYDRYVQEPKW